MLKRTKIIATLGPSTDRPGVLHQIVKAEDLDNIIEAVSIPCKL